MSLKESLDKVLKNDECAKMINDIRLRVLEAAKKNTQSNAAQWKAADGLNYERYALGDKRQTTALLLYNLGNELSFAYGWMP